MVIKKSYDFHQYPVNDFKERGDEPTVPTQSKIHQSITKQTKTGFISMKKEFSECIINRVSIATYFFLKPV